MPVQPLPEWDPWVGLAVALGCGLLIGIDRERRKGQGPGRGAAGIRSFTVAAMAGATSQWVGASLAQPALVLVGAAVVGGLAWLAYRRGSPTDPGLTTEVALFVTFLIGVIAMLDPVFGAASGVILAALLAGRRALRRFATEVLSEQELHDALMLAAIALVALPLASPEPLRWLGDISPRAIVLLVTLLLAVQGLGHIAVRSWGARHGLLLSGALSGFVSSTATVASFGLRARAHPHESAHAAAGAVASSAATWLLAVAVTAAVAPGLVAKMLPAALAGAAAAGAAALVVIRLAGPAQAPAGDVPDGSRRAFRMREALLIALLLAVVTAGVGWAQRTFGAAGYWAGLVLGALADAHAAVASAANVTTRQNLPAADFVMAMVLAVGVNTASRTVIAAVSGGTVYALRVGAGLWAGLAAGAAAAWFLR